MRSQSTLHLRRFIFVHPPLIRMKRTKIMWIYYFRNRFHVHERNKKKASMENSLCLLLHRTVRAMGNGTIQILNSNCRYRKLIVRLCDTIRHTTQVQRQNLNAIHPNDQSINLWTHEQKKWSMSWVLGQALCVDERNKN